MAVNFNNGNYCKALYLTASALFFAVILTPSDSYAYLDPGAGGWLYQMLFPVIVAVSGAWVVLQRHILGLWRRFFNAGRAGRLTEAVTEAQPNEKMRMLIMLPAVFAGVILPIEFISEANGYLGYLRPWELFPVFGWQWLFFAFTGIIISLLILLCAAFSAKIFLPSNSAMLFKTMLWFSISLFLLSLLRGAKLWLESGGFIRPVQIPLLSWAVVVLVGIFCAIWVSRSSLSAYNIIKFSRVAALVGCVLTLIAPVVTRAKSHSKGPLPVLNNTAGSAKRPNIILVTVDSLTTTHMSLYGYERFTTPRLETLAKEAGVYERFYANSNITNSSINSIVHGVRPWTHRTLQLPAMPLAAVAREGLVAKLKAAGYQTMAVATNRYAAPYINLTDQYFDQVAYGRINRLSARLDFVLAKFHHVYPLLNMLNIDQFLDDSADRLMVGFGVYSATNHFDPEKAFSVVRSMIQNRKADRPFFTWVHLYPPHSPYATPPPFIGRFDQSSRHRTRDDSSPPWCYEASADKSFPDEYAGRYDESVAYIDSNIGSFIDWLKARGIYDDALIVVSSDHGESFSHGYGAHSGPAMHEDLIHVPLIIKEPNQHKGRRIPFLSEQIDLMPTMLEYAGFPEAATMEGVSIKPGARLEKMNKPIFSMNFQQNYCFGQLITGTVVMIQGDWKYVTYFGDILYPLMPRLENSLYNLRTDPAENFNLISAQPVIANEMMSAIAAQLREHGGAVK